MTKEGTGGMIRNATTVVGATPTGVTKKVVASLGRQIKGVFGQNGKSVVVKGMRFIPSTKVDLGGGSFQVMANTVVEVAGSGGGSTRSQSVDSVVTVERVAGGQVLKGVKIPSLERMVA